MSSKKFSSGVLADFSTKKNWVLDADDCLYPISSGLHDYIKGNIVKTFNQVAANDPQRDLVVERLATILNTQKLNVKNPACIEAPELGLAFTPIVRVLKDVYPAQLFDYLDSFYGNRYDLIKPCPDMVEAFRLARDKGIGIYIYTNGPSSPEPGKMSHLQNVMLKRGFDDDMIEYIRGRTYDLLKSVQDGFGKPTLESMNNFLSYTGVKPNEALMADDQLKNLKTAAQVGMSTLWTWTTNTKPSAADSTLAKSIGAKQVRNTGAALKQIALAYKP